MTRRGRIAVAVAVAAAAALLASTAFAAWQYRGSVDDHHHTSLQLVVRHQGSEPIAVVWLATGRLHLQCKGGGRRRLAFPNEVIPRLRLINGRFGFNITSGGGGHVTKGVITGAVHRRRAIGSIHLWMRAGRHRCSSGTLSWHAHFEPRAPSG